MATNLMIIIDLIRHVKVDGKAALYGKTDIAPRLDDNNELLSQLIKRRQYDAIISSPLQRCRLLAQLLAKKTDKPLICLETLQEIDFGLYDGIAFEKIPLTNKTPIKNALVNWPMIDMFFQAPSQVTLPEAEPLTDFNLRIVKTWHALLLQQSQSLSRESQLKSPNSTREKRIAIIAHGGVIRMILAEVLAVDWQKPSWHQNLIIANGSLTTITVTRPFQDERFLQQVNQIGMPLIG